ncbi:MAG: cation:proton antiporter [Polyangiaceae bacterium]
MDPVALFLLAVAGIFAIGALGELIFQRTNVPDVIWLILAGIVLGPISGLLTRPMLSSIAPFFAAITLVVVLFEGGSKLRLGEIGKAAPRSSLLAVLSFLIATLVVAGLSMLGRWPFGLFPETWSWTHGLLLGAILGGSSSIIIMPAMAQARLPAPLANLVNIESALTDAFCVVATAAIIDLLLKGAGGAAAPAISLLKSFGIGLAIGGVAGLVWLLLLRFLRGSEHAYPITLAALLVLYVLIDHAEGSAALGILTVAIILGNAGSISSKIGLAEPAELDTEVRGFHRQMAFMIKSFFFVFIGAMLGPPWGLIVFGVFLGVVLFAARIPAVFLGTLGSKFTAAEKRMTAVAMPRGMAAGVLATLPMSAGVEGTEGLPVLVFACVFTTILVFAVGFPIVKRALPEAEDEEPESRLPMPAGAAQPRQTERMQPLSASIATPIVATGSPVATTPTVAAPAPGAAPDTQPVGLEQQSAPLPTGSVSWPRDTHPMQPLSPDEPPEE